MADVATRKLLENDEVIVWELLLEPGETTGAHTHEHDYIIHVIEGSTLLALDGGGNRLAEVKLSDGETHHFKVRDGVATAAGGLATPATHEARNIGPGRYREVMVEIK
ncbi:MAG: hypothetical protein GC201_14490 [Alphaproteobacteria bacterium]|nr:hypothetical protein [Alphaproteobacteria bacterium]